MRLRAEPSQSATLLGPDPQSTSASLLASSTFWSAHMLAMGCIGLLTGAAVGSYLLATPSGQHRQAIAVLVVVCSLMCAVTAYVVRGVRSERVRSLLVSTWLLIVLLLAGACAYLDGGDRSPITDYVVAPVVVAALTCPPRRVAQFGVIALATNAIVMSRSDGTPTVVEATQIGAALLLCVISVFAADNRRRHEQLIGRLLLDLRAQSRLDPLTGLPNRLAFTERLELEVDRSRRSGEAFVLAMIDLNRFKRVNDERGHAAGDALLRRVAEAFHDALRSTDFVARLGGDEFGLLLPFASGHEDVLQRIRVGVAGADELGVVTASVGAATYQWPLDAGQDVLARADAAMYAEKQWHHNHPEARVAPCLRARGEPRVDRGRAEP